MVGLAITGILGAFFGALGIILIQTYYFLATGEWAWLPTAWFLIAFGMDGESLYASAYFPDWPGLTMIVMWLLFACPAAGLVFCTGMIIGWIGLSASGE